MKIKTRFLSMLLVLLLVIPMMTPIMSLEVNADTSGAWDGTVATAFAGGSGTEADPYQIANGAQLAYLADLINSDDSATVTAYVTKAYKLTADINLGNREWTPIGGMNYSDSADRFKGIFDGDGHTISNLYISETQPTGAGLFCITGAATIKNLTLQGKITAGVEVIDGYTNNVAGCGMLMNAAYSTKIENVTVYANIAVKSSGVKSFWVGGFFGYGSYGTSLTNCKAYGTVEVKHSAGGLFVGGVAANVRSVTMTNVLSDVDVFVRDASQSTHYVGGLIGRCYSDNGGKDYTNLYGCRVTGNVHVNSARGRIAVGGIAGAIGTPAASDYTLGGTVNINSCSFDGNLYAMTEGDTGSIFRGSLTGLMRPYVGTVANFFTSSTEAIYQTDSAYNYLINEEETVADAAVTEYLTLTDNGGHVTGISVASDYGVAVRLTQGSTGLRFNSLIDCELYDTLAARDDLSVSLGTLITPTAYVEAAGAFTTERLDAFAKSNGFPVGYLDVEFVPGTHEWLNPYLHDAIDGNYYFSGAISNIAEQNYNRTFSGLGYVTVTCGGYAHTFYADYTDAARARTVGYVAMRATTDRSDTQTDIYKYLTADGDYSPYTETQLSYIKAYADAYSADAMNTEALSLIADGKSDYAIVYPFSAGEEEYILAVYLQHVIENLTGVRLPVRENLSTTVVKETEIAVGCYERAAAYHVGNATYGSAYSVTTSGKRILIFGNTATDLTSAVLAFVKEVFDIDLTSAKSLPLTEDATVSVDRFLNLSSADEGALTPLSTTLDGYTIVYTNGNYMQSRMAYSLQQSHLAATGVTLAIATSASGNKIVLADDSSLTEGDWSVSTAGSGTKTITVKAGSYYGFEGAEDYLIAEVLYGLAPITAAGFSTKGNYRDWVGSGFEEVTKYAYDKNGTLRVMFYNVLFGESAYGYTLPTDERNTLQSQMIAQYMPDVLACQEFNASKRGYTTNGSGGLAALLENLGYEEAIDPRVHNAYATNEDIPGTEAWGYLTDSSVSQGQALKGYGGGTSVTVNGETYKTYYNNTPLFYHTETTKLIEAEYYWYKCQWDKITGAEHENGASDCGSKSATWGLFETVATGQRYIVIGTHMCTRSDYIRGLQAQELVALIDELVATYHVPVFLGGDLNGNSDDSNYQHFVSDEVGYTDLASTECASLFSSELYSSHGYPDYDDTLGMMQPNTDVATDTTRYSFDSIDRILTANDSKLSINVFGIVSDECTRSSSDHYPVFCDAVIVKYDDYTQKY